MRKVIYILIFLTFTLSSNATDSLGIRLTIEDDYGEVFDNLIFGVHQDATLGIDIALGEKMTPEFPPPDGLYSVLFVQDTTVTDTIYWSPIDFREIPDEDYFVHIYSFKIYNLVTTYSLSWQKLPNSIDSAFIQDLFTGDIVNIDMKANQSAFFENFSQDKFKITVYYNKNVLSVEDNIKDKSIVDIYPNPTTDLINIRTQYYNWNYTITDIVGNTLMEGKISGIKKTLNLHKLETGIYFLIVDNHRGVRKVKKIIKI